MLKNAQPASRTPSVTKGCKVKRECLKSLEGAFVMTIQKYAGKAMHQ